MGKVAIIILNLDKKDDLLACLKSVTQMDHPSFEVIVVDNASLDGSVKAVNENFSKVHLICNEKNFGAPGGRNVGFEYALKHIAFDYVLFLDNDVIVTPSFLSELIHGLEAKKDAGIAGGKAYREYPSKTIMSTGLDVNFYTGWVGDIGTGQPDRGQFDEPKYVPAYGAFGLLIRKNALQDLNGFDDHFNPYGWGEVDLCLRAKKLGVKTCYVPQAIIYHKGCKVGRGIVPHYEKYKTRNYLFLMRRHAKGPQLVCIFFATLFRGTLRLLSLIFRGDFAVIAAHVDGVFAGIKKK